MSSYFIESFKIEKLWGYRDINLTFNNDVNVLIGPNGSGKTTILNLFHSILSGDLRSLVNFNFQHAEIKLKGFQRQVYSDCCCGARYCRWIHGTPFREKSISF